MAKIRYVAGDSEADTVSVFGYIFSDGKGTEVKDEDLPKFQGNPFFVEGGAPAKPAKKAEPENTDGLKAVHVGGGKYAIKEDGETVQEGLSKHEADSFNDLSDEDKAEYVAE